MPDLTDDELRRVLASFPRTAAFPTQALYFAETYGERLINELLAARATIRDGVKTKLEIQHAREFLYCEMGRADINELQRCILDGMLVALRWVTDGGKNQNTLQRLLDGTPIAVGPTAKGK